MTERERLIELIASGVCEAYSPTCDEWQPHYCGGCYANDVRLVDLADYLLSNGVIVPPCKVGDKVFSIFEYENKHFLDEGEVGSIYKDNGGIWVTVRYDSGLNYHHKVDKFDIQVFLTREEAEKALAERMKDNG